MCQNAHHRRAVRPDAEQAQVRSHDEAPKASEGQDGSTAEEPGRPRTFEEVVAANFEDPFHAARLARLDSGERFDDATANSNDQWQREVSVHPDCEGGPHWIVECGDSDGGCYVTTFDGPMAEQRARDYIDALNSGRLKALREI
jgi:hypothetical protein